MGETLSARFSQRVRLMRYPYRGEAMDMNAPLSELEATILQLPIEDQLRIVERLTQHIRETLNSRNDLEHQLQEMAADVEIQKELRDIGREFSVTEADGLGEA